MVRLLIADDEAIERAVLCKTLQENLGDRCAIFQAENGREALEIYEQERIQIALLDIEMPGIDGIQAAEEIRKKDKACCIIFLTAFDEFAYAKKAITVRALDYLLKPYDGNELMLVLEEAIRLAEQAAQAGRYMGSAPQAGLSDQPQTPNTDCSDLSACWPPRGFESASLSPGGCESASPRPGGSESASLRPGGSESAGPRPGGFESASLSSGSPSSQISDIGLGEMAQQRQTQVTQVIQRYIHDNYMYDLSMQDLAQMMNYSEAYFSRLFKQCFGRNFTSYIAEYRVNEARQLLKQSNVNIKEIGRAVGYPDSNYFTKVFRRITGQSPTEYRLSIFRKQDFSVSISDK
ncbi:MAG: response regulator [Lachnospiraceae bacterium]|nr:response regulator [Lachnospiraceae bacterium]